MDSRLVQLLYRMLVKKIDFVCVRILSVNGEIDSISTNNQLCELGFNNELILKLYPNPV